MNEDYSVNDVNVRYRDKMFEGSELKFRIREESLHKVSDAVMRDPLFDEGSCIIFTILKRQ